MPFKDFLASTFERSPEPQQSEPPLSRQPIKSHHNKTQLNYIDLVKTVPPKYKCVITQGLLRDPVVTASGHHYSREAIEKWLEKGGGKNTCPVTRIELTKHSLVADVALAVEIEDYRAKRSAILAIIDQNPPDLATQIEQYQQNLTDKLQDAEKIEELISRLHLDSTELPHLKFWDTQVHPLLIFGGVVVHAFNHRYQIPDGIFSMMQFVSQNRCLSFQDFIGELDKVRNQSSGITNRFTKFTRNTITQQFYDTPEITEIQLHTS